MTTEVYIRSGPTTGLLEVRLQDFGPSLKELQLSIPYGKVESGTAKLLQCDVQTDKRNLSRTDPLTVAEHKSQYLIEPVNMKLETSLESPFLTVRGTVPIHPTYRSYLYCLVKNSEDFKLSGDTWEMRKYLKFSSGGVDVQNTLWFYTLDTKAERMRYFTPTVDGPFSLTVYNMAPKSSAFSMLFPTFVSDEKMGDEVTYRSSSEKCTLHTRATEESQEVEVLASLPVNFEFTKEFQTTVRFKDYEFKGGVYSARYSCPSVVLKSHFPGRYDLVTMRVREFGDNVLEPYHAFVDGGNGDEEDDSTNGFEGVGMARVSLVFLAAGFLASLVALGV